MCCIWKCAPQTENNKIVQGTALIYFDAAESLINKEQEVISMLHQNRGLRIAMVICCLQWRIERPEICRHFLAAVIWCRRELLLLSHDTGWYLVVIVTVKRASNSSHAAPLTSVGRGILKPLGHRSMELTFPNKFSWLGSYQSLISNFANVHKLMACCRGEAETNTCNSNS